VHRITPYITPVASSVLLLTVLRVLLHVEEKTVVVMHSCRQFVHSEQGVHVDYLEGNSDDVGLLYEMGYYRFSLANVFYQSFN
jgi:hypothetical protein